MGEVLAVGYQTESASIVFRASSVEQVLCNQYTPTSHFSDLAFGLLSHLFPIPAMLWTEVSFCCFIASHLLVKYSKLKPLPLQLSLKRGEVSYCGIIPVFLT